MPIHLEGFSVLARVIRHAAYAEDHPPSQPSLWSIHIDMQTALRAERPEWIYNDRLHVTLPDREVVIPVDLRNTQFIGADRSVASFRWGYEPDIAICIDALVGDADGFIDVGANWGYFPVFLGTRPGFRGAILAIEGFPRAVKDLQHVVASAGLGHLVRIAGVAAGSVSGTVVMSEEYFTGNNRVTDDGMLRVPIRKLDDLAADMRDIRLLKIDVEGAETSVLQGGLATITRHRPVILFEHWLNKEGGFDRGPFEALTAVGGYRFAVIAVQPEPGTADQAHLTGTLTAVDAEKRTTFPERINVVAYPDEVNLLERLGAARS